MKRILVLIILGLQLVLANELTTCWNLNYWHDEEVKAARESVAIVKSSQGRHTFRP